MTYIDTLGHKRMRVSTRMVLTVDSPEQVMGGLTPSVYSGFYAKAAFSSLKSSLPANLITILNKKLSALFKTSRDMKEEAPFLGEVTLYFLAIYKHRLFKQDLGKNVASEVALG
jgi:hypothetical protein